MSNALSQWVAAGSPMRCDLVTCGKRFENVCYHAADNNYYCSEVCAKLAEDLITENVAVLKKARG